MAEILTEDDFTSDWPKARGWDLWAPRGGGYAKPMDELGELELYLNVSGKPFLERQTAVGRFLQLPAAMAMPAKLRAEITRELEL